MIKRLSLFTALTVLFAIQGKAQQDVPKDKMNGFNFNPAGKGEEPKEKNNYRSSDSYKNDNLLFILSTDLIQIALLHPNIGTDFILSKPLSLCLNVAYEIPSPIFAVNPLANGQFTYPGLVYHGLALRLGLKVYFDEGHPANYFCLQAVYKSISFSNVHFEDYYGTQDPQATNDYDMSEKTNLFGGDVFIGHNTASEDSRVCIDLFAGAGLHVMFRNFTISNQMYSDAQIIFPVGSASITGSNPIAADGNYNEVTDILAIIIGMKIVFKYPKKENR